MSTPNTSISAKSNYDEFCSRLKLIPEQVRRDAVESVQILGKSMSFMKEDYPGLIENIAIHKKKRLDEKIHDEIVKEMNDDENFRNFLCVNIQEFIKNLAGGYPSFFEKGDSSLVKYTIVKKFGFLADQKSISMEKFDLDESETNLYLDLEQWYESALNPFLGERAFNFKTHILKPFKRLLEILKFTSFSFSDDIIFISGNVNSLELQNLFTCMQFHIFFEDYINSLFREHKNIIRRPIILINPQMKNGRLEGYFELDGSFLIGGKHLIFLECKNSSRINLDYMTHFLGKVSLVERIYGLPIEKMLFSTGSRWKIWEQIENYPELKDIKIYDVLDFNNKYRGLKI